MRLGHRIILVVALGALIFFGYMAVERHQIEYPLDPISQRAVTEVTDKSTQANVSDYFWQHDRYFSTTFESLSGYGIIGPVTLGTQGGLVLKPTMVGFPAQIFNNVLPFQADSQMYFRVQIFFASGTLSNSAGTVVVGTNTSFGFSFQNADLYGLSNDANGTTIAKKIGTLTDASGGTGLYTLEARYFPNNRVVYFVNGIEQGTQPSNISGAFALVASSLVINFETTTSSVKEMDINTFEFLLKQ